MDQHTKTRIKLARTQHDVHVGLLMMNDGLSKPDAIVMAYLDGYQGLAGRMVPAEKTPGASDPTRPYAVEAMPTKQAKPEATK